MCDFSSCSKHLFRIIKPTNRFLFHLTQKFHVNIIWIRVVLELSIEHDDRLNQLSIHFHIFEITISIVVQFRKNGQFARLQPLQKLTVECLGLPLDLYLQISNMRLDSGIILILFFNFSNKWLVLPAADSIDIEPFELGAADVDFVGELPPHLRHQHEGFLVYAMFCSVGSFQKALAAEIGVACAVQVEADMTDPFSRVMVAWEVQNICW